MLPDKKYCVHTIWNEKSESWDGRAIKQALQTLVNRDRSILENGRPLWKGE
ncbi:hypothetical protein Enr17x_52220 [Gimesia fumaroli]|uniref:Uncharacterized protein n=1 Tax=Gimesia fumaroli TaxID=2527976 RepID=A0A518IJ98_9PLAN|nr:hypothetical protein Enr17x_52220 [Gimesia fumaroli]